MQTPPAAPAAPASSTAYDVLIAGAGPVGLLLASELALAGCAVLVLEKATDPHSPLKQLPFGLRGLNAPSVETLDRRGLLAELPAHQPPAGPAPAPAAGSRPAQGGGHFAGIPLQPDQLNYAHWPTRLPTSTPTQQMTELAGLETVLARRAATLGVAIRRGLAITGLHQTADEVTVQAGAHTFTGRWLVGCDGGRSAVRKLAGFDFVGTEPEFTGYTALVDIADPEKLRLGRHVTPTGMYMQPQPGYLILQDFDGGAAHRAGTLPTLAQVQALLRRLTGTDVTLTALHLATLWTDRARQAGTYRRGRVLLAGDAAHIHSPLGGQGLNLGLGDAFNLGWKLAATLRGLAPAGLLDSYTAERHPLGERVLDWSRAQVALMRPDAPARALHAIFRDLLATPDGATYVAGRIWGLGTRYDLGSAHPLVGQSAPNFALAAGPTLAELLRPGRGLLLDFTGHPALAALAAGYGEQLRYVAGPAREQLGLSALLVRPDGIVAWATDQPLTELGATEARQAAARWFVPLSA